MPDRLLANLPIEELEKLFDEKRASGDVLTSLLAELSHRDTARSRALTRRVVGALAYVKPTPSFPAKPYRMTPEQHRSFAENLRRGEADWTEEDRKEALLSARQHDLVANAIEKSLAKKK